jgi:hypothetical protein
MAVIQFTKALRASVRRNAALRAARRAGDMTQWVVTCDWDWEHHWALYEIDELHASVDNHLRDYPTHTTVQLWRYNRRVFAKPSAPVVIPPTELREIDCGADPKD